MTPNLHHKTLNRGERARACLAECLLCAKVAGRNVHLASLEMLHELWQLMWKGCSIWLMTPSFGEAAAFHPHLHMQLFEVHPLCSNFCCQCHLHLQCFPGFPLSPRPQDFPELVSDRHSPLYLVWRASQNTNKLRNLHSEIMNYFSTTISVGISQI